MFCSAFNSAAVPLTLCSGMCAHSRTHPATYIHLFDMLVLLLNNNSVGGGGLWFLYTLQQTNTDSDLNIPAAAASSHAHSFTLSLFRSLTLPRHTLSHFQQANAAMASDLGIPAAAAVTCVKPSGTVSQLCDSASGIHPRHSEYYIRRVRCNKDDPLTAFMLQVGWLACERFACGWLACERGVGGVGVGRLAGWEGLVCTSPHTRHTPRTATLPHSPPNTHTFFVCNLLTTFVTHSLTHSLTPANTHTPTARCAL